MFYRLAVDTNLKLEPSKSEWCWKSYDHRVIYITLSQFEIKTLFTFYINICLLAWLKLNWNKVVCVTRTSLQKLDSSFDFIKKNWNLKLIFFSIFSMFDTIVVVVWCFIYFCLYFMLYIVLRLEMIRSLLNKKNIFTKKYFIIRFEHIRWLV